MILMPIACFAVIPFTFFVQSFSNDHYLPVSRCVDSQGTLNIVKTHEPSQWYFLAVYSWIFDTPIGIFNTYVGVGKLMEEYTTLRLGHLVVSAVLLTTSILSIPVKVFVGRTVSTQGEVSSKAKTTNNTKAKTTEGTWVRLRAGREG